MKRFLLITLQIFFFSALAGQTIIDLNPGGGVRSKAMEDYQKDEPGWEAKVKTDSLKYNDNLTRALNALYRDSVDQAERLLTEALKLRPHATSNYIVRHYLGRIAIAKGDPRKAISILTTLLKDYPEFRDARFDRASCYLEIKNTRAALEDCKALFHAQLTETEHIKALFLRSACYTEDRHPEKAKTDLEEILRIDPINESALLLLAFTYEQMGQPAEALNRMNIFVSSHPTSVVGWVARAELEERQKMYDLARTDLDEAIRLSPKDAALYVKRAQLLSLMNLPILAEKDTRKAIDLGYPAEAIHLPNKGNH